MGEKFICPICYADIVNSFDKVKPKSIFDDVVSTNELKANIRKHLMSHSVEQLIEFLTKQCIVPR